MITIVPYKPAWPDEFRVIGASLRLALGDLALRIDHIGSTSVPGLASKDIIDVQVTVQALDARVERAFADAGYTRSGTFLQDHLPPGADQQTEDWVKWFFRPPAGQRATNTHVRIDGRANQRYALLFRDYLRAHTAAAEGYARVKRALATYHADNITAYLDVKDPVCDIIMAGAEEWAALTQWKPGAPV